jgi:Rod binding domain-containing protein
MDHRPYMLMAQGCALALTPYFFMDIKSVKPAPLPVKNDLDTQLKKAAKMYEQQFLGEMMRAMRKTVDHGGITKPSMAEKIYEDELQGQYVEKWADSGGNGLADVIYRELKEKIIPSQYSRYVQQQPTVPPKKDIKGE